MTRNYPVNADSRASPVPCRHPTPRAGSAWAHAASSVVMEVLLWGSIIIALVLKSWYALLILPVGLILWGVVIGHTFSLRPIERSGVRAARRKAVIHVVGAALVIGTLAYFFAER